MAIGEEILVAATFLKVPTMANSGFHIKKVGVGASGTGDRSEATGFDVRSAAPSRLVSLESQVQKAPSLKIPTCVLTLAASRPKLCPNIALPERTEVMAFKLLILDSSERRDVESNRRPLCIRGC